MQQHDSWLICGPPRTGSMLISKYILNAYKQKEIDLTFRKEEGFNLFNNGPTLQRVYTRDNEYLLKLNNRNKHVLYSQLIHTHDYTYFNFVNKNTKIVIPVRNILDSCLSWKIMTVSKEQHYYTNDDTIINPFSLDLIEFKEFFTNFCNFYKFLKIPHNAVVVDYNLYSNNVTNLSALLGLECEVFTDLPIKTPGHYSEWILNWNELLDFTKNWETNPTTFIRP